jgi:methionyl-tRNA synthetase
MTRVDPKMIEDLFDAPAAAPCRRTAAKAEKPAKAKAAPAVAVTEPASK